MWIITAWQRISQELRKILSSAVFLVQWMGLMMVCCGMAVKRRDMLGVSVRKKQALTVQTETMIH
jgi:hypothetical protein